MKKLLLTLALVGSVSGAFAQGTITYYNRVANDVVALIYGFNPGNPPEQKFGNTSSTAQSFPTGSQTYAGAALAGTGYSVTLWAAASGSAMDQLVFVPGSLDTFRTGGGAGLIDNQGGIATIPNVASGASAALQLRVWDNAGGTITSWEQATTGNNRALYIGYSQVFNSPLLGGGQTPPPNMTGLTSFNIYAVPEPSTFVLAGLGAAALMVIRRRK